MTQVKILVVSSSVTAPPTGSFIECSPLWIHNPIATLTIGHYHERHYISTAPILVEDDFCKLAQTFEEYKDQQELHDANQRTFEECKDQQELHDADQRDPQQHDETVR